MNSTWHIITPEYPPQPGGVGDYTRLVAHRDFGEFSGSDLRRVDQLLDQFESPRRLLVQWVPHGFGKRAMNISFCWWLLRRGRRASRRGDRVELMVHEPFLEFQKRSWRQNAVAVVHRLMTIVLLRAASRVWISIPAWEEYWRPYALGRKLRFNWLPVVSNIPVVNDPEAIRAVRSQYVSTEGSIVGHFGAYDRDNIELLFASVSPLVGNGSKHVLLLLGKGGERVRDKFIDLHPEMKERVHATGALDALDLSLHLGACDVMLQPYVDGVSSRRGGTMAALAHGLPVITTSGRLTEPLWAESGAVAIVPVEDVAGVAAATSRLLPDVHGRSIMGRLAKALYAERFDVEVIVRALRG